MSRVSTGLDIQVTKQGNMAQVELIWGGADNHTQGLSETRGQMSTQKKHRKCKTWQKQNYVT